MTATKLEVVEKRDGVQCDVPGCTSRSLEIDKAGWGGLAFWSSVAGAWQHSDVCPKCVRRLLTTQIKEEKEQ